MATYQTILPFIGCHVRDDTDQQLVDVIDTYQDGNFSAKHAQWKKEMNESKNC